MSEQQQHPQQQYMQHQPPQQPMTPVQPANVYHSPAQSPAPQGQGQALPPSYDQAKAAPNGIPPSVAQQAGPVAVVPLNMLGDQPQHVDCPFCRQRTLTEVRKEGSSMQIIVGVLFCLVCVCLTCVPCLAHWFEDTEWHCTQCKNLLARRRHDGPLEVLGPQVAVHSQYAQQPQMNAQAAPVQTKDASAFTQPQQYEMQPQHPQQHVQQHVQHPQQYHYQQQPQHAQEIQPVYQGQQYQQHPQQQYMQSPTPQPEQKQ